MSWSPLSQPPASTTRQRLLAWESRRFFPPSSLCGLCGRHRRSGRGMDCSIDAAGSARRVTAPSPQSAKQPAKQSSIQGRAPAGGSCVLAPQWGPAGRGSGGPMVPSSCTISRGGSMTATPPLPALPVRFRLCRMLPVPPIVPVLAYGRPRRMPVREGWGNRRDREGRRAPAASADSANSVMGALSAMGARCS